MFRNRECGPKKKFSSRISTNSGVKTEKKNGLHLKKCSIFHDFWGGTTKKKGSLSQNLQKKQFWLTNSRVTTNILRVSSLKLHFSGTELVTFLGHNPRLEGYNSRLGGQGFGMPPRGVGPGEVLFLAFTYTRKKIIY